MWRYNLLYNVVIYIVLPTIEDCIVIPFAGDYTVIFSTEDCFMNPLFAASILLNVIPYTFYLRICSVTIT